VIPFEPTITNLEPVLTVVLPEVFPPVDTPSERFWFVASSVTVVAPAAVPSERETMLVPTSTNLDPVFTVVLPAVFPPVDTPIESTSWVCTV
jgi:hypothetical protein